jgi:CBS domain-containing protein
MRIDELMTRPVHTCRADERLSAAAQIMWERDTGFVPVVNDDNRPIGAITDRDICMATHFRGLPPAAIRVADVMTTPIHTVRTTDSISVAEILLRRHQIRRLPVVDAGGAIVGVLSLNDIALVTGGSLNGDGIHARAFAATLAAISQHRNEALQTIRA